MPAKRTLLQNGIVLSLDNHIGNFDQADVLIDGSKIAAVGPNLDASDAEVIDASNMIVMPGFIDTHRHIWQGIIRNMGVDHALGDYFANIMGKLSPVYRPQDAFAGNYVSALGAIDAGITTLLDWSHIQITPEHTDAAINALQESGIRGVFGYGTPSLTTTDWWQSSGTNHAENIKRIAKQFFSSKDQLLSLARAPRGPDLTPYETAVEDWNLAREVGIRITVHVGVGQYGGLGNVGKMGRDGYLGPDTTYIHCNALSDEEFQMIADTGGTVSVSSSIEMQMGHGIPPIQRMLDQGIRPSLSVDVETAIIGDMFTQMRAVYAIQRALAHERVEQGLDEVPSLITARDVLEFATIEGARANDLLDRVGTLTPGKEADIILLRTDRLNVMPVNDPIGAVVLGMDISNIDSVFIAGEAKKRQGELVGIDLKAVQRMVTESRDYVVRASGYETPAL